MTGCGLFLSNSVELARSRPSTLRANSATAHCMPRQMPKKGMPRSRAKRMASTLPSMPRSPNPPGTSRPSTPARSRSGPSRSTASLWIRWMRTWARLATPGVVQGLVDRLVGVAVLGVLAHHGDADLVLGVAQAVQQVAPLRPASARRPSAPASARSARPARSRPGSSAPRRRRSPCPSPRSRPRPARCRTGRSSSARRGRASAPCGR